MQIKGSLRVHPANPRYFTDDGRRAVYLTGSHTWANLQDIGLPGGPAFPYEEYLASLQSSGHNFMRLWMFEHPERASWTAARIVFDPLPWARTGPGLAADGKLKWVWKCFLRGHQPIFMDPWWPLYIESSPDVTPWAFVGGISKDRRDYPDWEPIRRAMGDTRCYAQKMDLAAMTPHPELASTRYCLANPGKEYLVYLPEGGSVTLNLCAARGDLAVEWFLPAVNRIYPGARPLPGGDYVVTVAPFTGDAALYLKAITT